MFHLVCKKNITTLFMLLFSMLFLFGSQHDEIKIGIDENLGAQLPMDAVFVMSNGDTLKLNEKKNAGRFVAFSYWGFG